MEAQLAHLHLIINHLPIIGSILGTLVLAYGLAVKSKHTKIAGYAILILSAIGAAITFATGEPAEEIIEHISGITRQSIKTHENSADISLAIMFALGISSLAGLYTTYFKTKFKQSIAILTLILGLISFVSISITGYLGGKIRHTEFATTTQTQQINNDDNSKNEYEKD